MKPDEEVRQTVSPDHGWSEFGTIVGRVADGSIVVMDDKNVVFISSAHNPLTARQLRDIAFRLDAMKVAWS